MVAILSAAVVGGCSHYVFIQDSKGYPVTDATVVVQTATFNIGQGKTDSDGKCSIDRFYLQSPRWLDITKPGYARYYGDYPDTWPCTVVLQNAPEGYEDEVFDPFLDQGQIEVPRNQEPPNVENDIRQAAPGK